MADPRKLIDMYISKGRRTMPVSIVKELMDCMTRYERDAADFVSVLVMFTKKVEALKSTIVELRKLTRKPNKFPSDLQIREYPK